MPIFKSHIKNAIEGGRPVNFDEQTILNFLNPSDNSKYVSARIALQNSDIFSIVSQLSNDLAIVKYRADSDRTQSLLNNPSATSNGHAFWQSMFAQLLLGGQCFAYRWRNVNGVDLRWEYLRPSQVMVYLLNDGSGLTYTISFDEPEIGVIQNIPASDVIHMRLLSTNGGMTGISPLTALANELQVKDNSNKLTLSALVKSITNPGVLSIQKGGLLGADEKSARSRSFMKQVNDSDGGPIVLDDLEKYEPLEVKSNVAQLLAQTDWTGRQIAKVFGVPDSYLNGQGDQQSNLDQIKGMYANALNRYALAASNELDDKLNANITVDLQPALDPFGDAYAGKIAEITRDGGLTQNQAEWLLKDVGYIPSDTPAAQQPTTPTLKGGENDNEND